MLIRVAFCANDGEMAGDRCASYEDLAAVVVAPRVVVAALKRRLGQNSQHSSKPPSTDWPFTPPAPGSLRRDGGHKPGGRPGRPGSRLTLRAAPGPRSGAQSDTSKHARRDGAKPG